MKMFENAYLGKSYKTREGKRVIFLRQISETVVEIANEQGLRVFLKSDGHFISTAPETLKDVIGEWKISDDDLLEIADANFDGDEGYSFYHDGVSREEHNDAFMAGYRYKEEHE